MPITPLHLGILAPINHFAKDKVSTAAFVIANVLADLPVLLHVYAMKVQEMGGPVVTGGLHETGTHTFLGAVLLGTFLGMFRPKTLAWWLGSLLGTVSHVLLDMVVHADMQPFALITTWNPFYIPGSIEWLSLGLGIGLVFWVLMLRDQRKASLPI